MGGVRRLKASCGHELEPKCGSGILPACMSVGGVTRALPEIQQQQLSLPSITNRLDTSLQYLYGPAMAIAADSYARPVISATTYGSGRVVLFGDTEMLRASLSNNLGRLIQNAAAWAAGGKTSGIKLAGSTADWTDGPVAGLVAKVRAGEKASGLNGGSISFCDFVLYPRSPSVIARITLDGPSSLSA